MKKTVVSFRTLIISSTPQVNLSPTRPKSSHGRRKARPAAQVTRAYSQAKLTSISLIFPPTCALACSSKSLSYSRVSPAACSFNAAKSFLVLSSSAGMKTKPEKVNCDLFTHVSWASGSFFFKFLSSDWLLTIFLYYWAAVIILIFVLWFYNNKPLTFAHKGDQNLISPHNITPKSLIHPLIPKITLVILLTVCHTVLVMLVGRIWYWMNL